MVPFSHLSIFRFLIPCEYFQACARLPKRGLIRAVCKPVSHSPTSEVQAGSWCSAPARAVALSRCRFLTRLVISNCESADASEKLFVEVPWGLEWTCPPHQRAVQLRGSSHQGHGPPVCASLGWRAVRGGLRGTCFSLLLPGWGSGHQFNSDSPYSLVAQLVKNLPAMQEMWVQSLG